jgi:Family of unknown function (DUF5977)
MYFAYATATIKCAEGTNGPSLTRGASATSVISQRDADTKAKEFAAQLAYQCLLCEFPPEPGRLIFCSAPVTASAVADPGYVPQTFTVSLPSCAVFSYNSQAEADAAAQVAAQVEADHERDTGQKLIFYNTEQTYSNTCNAILGPDYGPATVTYTVPAGAVTSNTSQAQADFAAAEIAKNTVLSLLASSCLPLFRNSAQSFTATCTLPLVGAPVTVIISAGAYTSTVSQADADAQALAAATASANAQIVCAAGFYNVAASGHAACFSSIGPGWCGPDTFSTVPAGVYFNTTQALADAAAQNQADQLARNALLCTWCGGGVEP